MISINDKFKRARLDQSPYLFHFINGYDPNPHETLRKILEEKQLKSGNDYICFSASPITAIKNFFNIKMNRTGTPMYYPYGIGFSRDLLVRDFKARNVIYIDDKKEIPDNLLWRAQILNINVYDFEFLREWRIKGNFFDFSTFPKNDMIIIAPDRDKLNDLIVNFNMEFVPYINYYTGDIEENWNESFEREWKGIAIDELGEIPLDDYAIASSTIFQIIGEDMIKNILKKSSLNFIIPKKNR